MDSVSELKLVSLVTQLMSPGYTTAFDRVLQLRVIPFIARVMFLVRSMDWDSQPKPESEFMSLARQITSLLRSMDLDSQPKPLLELISLISHKNFLHKVLYLDVKFVRQTSLFRQTFSLEPEPVLMSLIYRIFSLAISMNLKREKSISLCPQAEVTLEEGKFLVEGEAKRWSNSKWECLPFNWIRLTGEDATHFRCCNCNGENHKEYNKAPAEIKHIFHRKHSLLLVLLTEVSKTRECYCCDEDLKWIFYYCSVCDFAMCFTCAEKPQDLSIDHPKWHEHALAPFPREASLTCNVCALAHSSSLFYICPPCDFVIHQSCFRLPRVIRISRHLHRIAFTSSYDQGDFSCGVCRTKIDSDYGGYSCIKKGCSYAAHSKCATQSNVWDGQELEGVPEEIEEEEIEPFVRISNGIIQHFSHQHHHLRLDENMGRDYDEDKQCQACITPIYFGNFYSCMQCDFILHEECANLCRRIYHPIHPHLLTLIAGYDGVIDSHKDQCSVCPWLCKSGFFYECDKEGCDFKLHVQCGKISEPLIHESHVHPLFLTSKPGEKRVCSLCDIYENGIKTETFNCIECNFALCFDCATLPLKVRYKHDKHTLTLFYGKETRAMKYWCEVCEQKIYPEQWFYMCDEYCCVTLHTHCLLGLQLYMKPSSLLLYHGQKVNFLPNNHHMSRPICSKCEKRCLQKIIFQCSGLIFCSFMCIW